jgi:hypothetical protein
MAPRNARQWEDQVCAAHGYQPLKYLDKLGPGSEWTYVNTLAFRVLSNKANKLNSVPDFLEPYFKNAKQSVKASTDIKILCQVLKAQWREWPRSKLIKTGGMFGGFLSCLAEVREVKAVVASPKSVNLRAQTSYAPEHPGDSDNLDLMSSFGSSSGSSSLVSSTYADQPMYTAQNKSEPITNQAFNMFLDALSLLRPRDDSPSTLEWAKTHDSLSIPLPSKIVVESIDDGGLVLRYQVLRN